MSIISHSDGLLGNMTGTVYGEQVSRAGCRYSRSRSAAGQPHFVLCEIFGHRSRRSPYASTPVVPCAGAVPAKRRRLHRTLAQYAAEGVQLAGDVHATVDQLAGSMPSQFSLDT